jgi:hypothetical protein
VPNWTTSSSSALSRWSRDRKLTLARLHRGGVREAMTAYGPASWGTHHIPRERNAAGRGRRSPARSIGWCWFRSEHIEPYELELGRPGMWLRIDLEKPPSTQMSCPVT